MLEWSKSGFADFLDGHTFHLDEPACTTDGGLNDDIGLAPESHVEHLLNQQVVRIIAQVDYHLTDILIGAISLFQQGLDIRPHAFRLLDDVLGVFDLTLVVDAGSA